MQFFSSYKPLSFKEWWAKHHDRVLALLRGKEINTVERSTNEEIARMMKRREG